MRQLVTLREQLTAWAEGTGLTGEQVETLQLAAYEAMANVAMHAYPGTIGTLALHATSDGQSVTVTVADRGQWQPPPAPRPAADPPPRRRGHRRRRHGRNHRHDDLDHAPQRSRRSATMTTVAADQLSNGDRHRRSGLNSAPAGRMIHRALPRPEGQLHGRGHRHTSEPRQGRASLDELAALGDAAADLHRRITEHLTRLRRTTAPGSGTDTPAV